MSNEEIGIRVKITPHDEDTWNTVVNDWDAVEKLNVEELGSDYFIVEYDNETEFNKAVIRFDGLINYTRLNKGE